MRRWWMVLAALIVSCAARHDGNLADLGAADLASAPTDWGTFVCAQSLATYCAKQPCPADLATARATPWCSGDLAGWRAFTGTCTGLAYVESVATDSGVYYMYDASSGALVAVVDFNNGEMQCAGGPLEIDLRSCTDGAMLCPSLDGGS